MEINSKPRSMLNEGKIIVLLLNGYGA